ncbi:TPA: hypothetical protein J1Z77_005064, partial [Escherichia coli]|nr:hypothetical protein [Escherichia coli]HBA7909242.1 hypothetical protein [Escherichia coli]
VSGSAMAWTQNGTGGSVDLGGTLTPVEKVTPWEVKMGSEINGLDASIGKGQKIVEVKMPKNALIMGIRTQTTDVFRGGERDITPLIDFNGAVDLDSFSNGVATLTLDVKQGESKIGTMQASFESGAEASFRGIKYDANKYSLYAPEIGRAFFGGLSKTAEGSSLYGYTIAKKYDPEIVQHYNEQDNKNAAIKGTIFFDNVDKTYSGFYSAGIPVNSSVVITLDHAASGDTPIQWKASLPVTVSYQ